MAPKNNNNSNNKRKKFFHFGVKICKHQNKSCHQGACECESGSGKKGWIFNRATTQFTWTYPLPHWLLSPFSLFAMFCHCMYFLHFFLLPLPNDKLCTVQRWEVWNRAAGRGRANTSRVFKLTLVVTRVASTHTHRHRHTHAHSHSSIYRYDIWRKFNRSTFQRNLHEASAWKAATRIAANEENNKRRSIEEGEK